MKMIDTPLESQSKIVMICKDGSMPYLWHFANADYWQRKYCVKETVSEFNNKCCMWGYEEGLLRFPVAQEKPA